MGTESNEEKSEEQRYYRAEIHLKEGGQDYDVMGWAGQKSRSSTIFSTNTKNIFISYTYKASSPETLRLNIRG